MGEKAQWAKNFKKTLASIGRRRATSVGSTTEVPTTSPLAALAARDCLSKQANDIQNSSIVIYLNQPA